MARVADPVPQVIFVGHLSMGFPVQKTIGLGFAVMVGGMSVPPYCFCCHSF
jgi:hypothetical protein